MKVLDHGYAEVIEYWGSDERVIEAARMSTGKGFLGWGPRCSKCGVKKRVEGLEGNAGSCGDGGHIFDVAGDEKLLRRLWVKKHATPFEMAGMTIEVQAPIFVFREWHRHRSQSFNEMSARYTPLPDVNYIPTVERLLLGSDGKNKQAGTIAGAFPLTRNQAEMFQTDLRLGYQRAQETYDWSLAAGVPKELARLCLPVARYSRMRASANLRNWLAFLTLRLDEDAQWEIRQYAEVVGKFIEAQFPRTWELFNEGMLK